MSSELTPNINNNSAEVGISGVFLWNEVTD